MSVSNVNRSNRSGGIAPKSKAKSASSAGGFSAPDLSEKKALSGTANVTALGSVDALLALQSVPDAMGGRRRAVKRAENMLDILDQIKIGLLSGGISQSHLNRLIAVVSTRRDAVSDPELIEVIDEIELRARVELAKLGHIAA